MLKQNEPLSNDAIVYRAIKNKAWVQNGKLQAVAFFRRPVTDADGVSVSESAENAVKLLKRVERAAQLRVLEIRSARKTDGSSFNFDVIHYSIEQDPFHALITGIPYYYDGDPCLANEAADMLLACVSPEIVTVALSHNAISQ